MLVIPLLATRCQRLPEQTLRHFVFTLHADWVADPIFFPVMRARDLVFYRLILSQSTVPKKKTMIILV